MKLKKLLINTLLLGGIVATAFGVASCKKSDSNTLYVATKGGPSPFIYVDDNDKLAGYDIEVVEKAAELIDYKVEFTKTDEALTGTAAGLYDFTVNNWSYNESRAETYYFSYPYTKPGYTVVARKDRNIYATFEEWGEKHLTFGGSSTFNITSAIEKWNKNNPTKNVNVKYIDTDVPTQLLKLQNGDYDFIVIDVVMASQYKTTYADTFKDLQTLNISQEETNTNISKNTTSHLLFGKSKKGSEELRNKISEAIKTLKDDGTLLELSKKYFFGEDLTPSTEDFVYLN